MDDETKSVRIPLHQAAYLIVFPNGDGPGFAQWKPTYPIDDLLRLSKNRRTYLVTKACNPDMTFDAWMEAQHNGSNVKREAWNIVYQGWPSRPKLEQWNPSYAISDLPWLLTQRELWETLKADNHVQGSFHQWLELQYEAMVNPNIRGNDGDDNTPSIRPQRSWAELVPDFVPDDLEDTDDLAAPKIPENKFRYFVSQNAKPYIIEELVDLDRRPTFDSCLAQIQDMVRYQARRGISLQTLKFEYGFRELSVSILYTLPIAEVGAHAEMNESKVTYFI